MSTRGGSEEYGDGNAEIAGTKMTTFQNENVLVWKRLGLPKSVGTREIDNKGECELSTTTTTTTTTTSAFMPAPGKMTCSSTGEMIQVLDAERDDVKDHLPEFNLNAFERHYASSVAGQADTEEWHVLAGRRLSSTQKVLEENVSNLPDNTIIISDTQTEGKGNGDVTPLPNKHPIPAC